MAFEIKTLETVVRRKVLGSIFSEDKINDLIENLGRNLFILPEIWP